MFVDAFLVTEATRQAKGRSHTHRKLENLVVAEEAPSNNAFLNQAYS